MWKVTLGELEHFVVLAEHGSVTDAARVIRLSQPAMSSSLQELEKALGVTLFVRYRGQGLGLAHRRADRGGGAGCLSGARQIVAAVSPTIGGCTW